ncbi:MAG: 3-oxoacyl-ACP reductase [Firmicutes bacterium HGW-Firmicutes-11]|jgi:3alpha(or 20beta)-hydroxysteroid dehydrogenase|nr:MAG: 3-oxoacyl-ACP reductase [Firmicutes bacterium HGW-Firmicutes-11]
MMFSLKNKVAVVTGGGSGLGLATVRRFVEAGATVVMADISDHADLAAEVGCDFIKADVTSEKDMEALMRLTSQRHGLLDIVVNNAGIISPEQRIEDAVVADYEKLYRVNAIGVLLGIKYGAKHMKDGGAILNTASNSANGDFSGYGAYIASKCAVVGITKAAAIEYADRGIRVNCICPNTIDTPMAYVEGCETELQVVGVITPLGRMCKAEEAAALFHFLASDDCGYITGEDIYIDGGMKAGHGDRKIEYILKALEAESIKSI